MWKNLDVKYPLLFSDFNQTWLFSTDFRKSSNIKIRPVGAQLFHADEQTDQQSRTDRRRDGWMGKTKLMVAFRNFANSSKNGTDVEAVTFGVRKPLIVKKIR